MTTTHAAGEAVARSLVAAATVLTVLCMTASFAVAQNRSGAGTLTCRANAGTELTTNLRQRMRCSHVTHLGRVQTYSGVIARFEGGAVPRTGRSMRWSVLATTRALARDALVGRYVAVDSTGPAGTRAGDLVGEGAQSIVLRPSSSARGRSGVNVASGVKDISIDHWRRPRNSTM